ncbi:ABC transporter permease [Cryobacterium sp. TMT1-3]|uniref:ABC transporter permease n=1 Tax=Cryobacterium luteum TaxID=1424661 RepID=A0A1H8A982_9MICO|nr:ABC transporter permease [Cryobacterium luteum]TFC24472.1 ABC transporter permease [Cryobacterium sp. TMT1-3]SEM67452.1 monosaccharide ABC transporter membrane protein, CUT2 family [Cryobacterium luteum]
MSEQITQPAPPTPVTPDTRPGIVKRMLAGSAGRNLGLVIAFALLIVVGILTAGDRFASFDNFVTIIRFASIVGVVCVGMTFVITAGGIDLSVGSVVGLSSVVASLTAVQLASAQSSWLLIVVVALLVGTLAGFVNGVVIAYGGVVAFMATLAMLVGARGLAELISNRSTQIVNNQEFMGFFRADLLGVPILIWIFIIVAVAGWILLNRTTFGRRTVAVGGNAEASRLAGIKVKRHMVYVYMLSGLTAGIAGVMFLGRTTVGTSTHGTLLELDVIAAVVVGGTLLIGGRGTIVGSVLGILIFSTLTNVFTQNNLSTSVQNVAKGVIIVAAVLLQQRFASRGSRSK